MISDDFDIIAHQLNKGADHLASLGAIVVPSHIADRVRKDHAFVHLVQVTFVAILVERARALPLSHRQEGYSQYDLDRLVILDDEDEDWVR